MRKSWPKTLEDVKVLLPDYIDIKDETYQGFHKSATFIDKDYNTEFIRTVRYVVVYKSGCNERQKNHRQDQKLYYSTEYIQDTCNSVRSRKELQDKFPTIFNYIKNNDIPFNLYCSHFIKSNSSRGEEITKLIAQKLLHPHPFIENCRDAIPCYRAELDIYFPTLKIAFEYNGWYFHKKEHTMNKDTVKKIKCAENGILLLVINESREGIEHTKDIIVYIKQWFIQNIDKINNYCNILYHPLDINSLDISIEDVYKHLTSLDDIKSSIKECSSLTEFKVKHKNSWNILRYNDLLYLLNDLPIIRDYNKYTDEEFIQKATTEFTSYADFIRSKLFKKLINNQNRRKILDTIRDIFPKFTHNKYHWSAFSDFELINFIAKKFSSYKEFSKNKPLYKKCHKRGLVKTIKINFSSFL